MKVRATKDGHYAGYYRVGPIVGDQGSFAGEVFEIDDKPYPILDLETGKPVFETDGNGNPILDQKTKNPKIKTGVWFTPEWMEQVSDDTPSTFDYPTFEIPIQYRAKKVTADNRPKQGGVQAPASVI